MKTVEFRVRPVIRYIVTKYTAEDRAGSCETIGEFQNEDMAETVKAAMESIPVKQVTAPLTALAQSAQNQWNSWGRNGLAGS